MPLSQMGFDECACLGIYLAGDVRLEHVFAEGRVAVLAHAAEELRRGKHQGREAEDADTETGHDADQFHDIAGRHVAALHLLLEKGDRRIARYDRAIEIEQRPDFRAVR